MLNVSQAAEISYNVGTMPRNIGSLDAGLKKEKATGAKDRGRKGSWRTMKKKKRKKDWLHHIACVWPSSR